MNEDVGPTPGPWIVSFAREHLPGYRIVNALDGLQHVTQEMFQARHEANRALIEALPELRERLRRAQEVNEKLQDALQVIFFQVAVNRPTNERLNLIEWTATEALKFARAEEPAP